MRVSVLDQSPISEGSSGADALRNTLDLAQLADRLGYHRYWVAEHHGGPMLAGPSPEALIGPIASATSGIRVGSGGVMLPHYSPFKVAETFSLLAGLFPDRIDLGIGRAPGTDPLTTYALQRDRRQASPDDFPNQLVELLGYFDDSLPADHPFKRLAPNLRAGPTSPSRGCSGPRPRARSGRASSALPYAFADFINSDGAGIAASYRNRFAAEHGGRDGGPVPRTAVAVWAVCAETDEEARHLAASRRMTMRLLRQGQLIQVPPPDKAVAWLRSQGLPETGSVPGRRADRRRAEQVVREGLERAAEEYGADELVVVTITFDHQARRRSYELLAEAMELEPRDPRDRTSRPPASAAL